MSDTDDSSDIEQPQDDYWLQYISHPTEGGPPANPDPTLLLTELLFLRIKPLRATNWFPDGTSINAELLENFEKAGSRPDFKLKSEYDVVDLTVRNERGRLASWALHSGHLDVPDEYREDVDTSETEYIESVAQLYNGGFPALHPADTPESRHTRSIIISRDFNQEAAHELEYGEPTEQSGDFLDKVVEYSRRIRTAYDEEDCSGFSREFCRLTQEWNRTVEDLWDLGIVDVPHPLPVEESSSEEEGSAMEE
ncbi:hypothetical protein L202_03282 [Cryptococcus amylolentus CBS 6039]|uniref:Uncharacterized protein n=1 Tax=Cryptococcus amylolentus CBS 6039 TaxID=1295533 RepID=A0A1E3HSC8_9TREE|nr:hypothetical protein L202_03282 [Cryptococcus amylolentus CBS 6039]ODN79268.1 hypothetical protein L202_03282 [Cryptococcus amylolentus CBS 6039]